MAGSSISDAVRIYFCTYIGAGSNADPYRVGIYDHMSQSTATDSGFCDLRKDAARSSGFAIVWANTTDAEHESILNDTGCTYIAPSCTAGVSRSLAGDVADISMLTDLLAMRGVDTTSVNETSTVLDLLLLAFPGMQ
jgi:hypothetical protein